MGVRGQLITDPAQTKDQRFYGRRKGHALSPARRLLIENLLPELRVGLPGGGDQIEMAALFGEEKRAYCLEIGFGAGEHLAAVAAANPSIGFIGCEPFINGVAALLAQIDRQALTNIRVYDEDARRLLPRLPEATFERLYLLYADPWPKKRHNRRRFIQPDTVGAIARVLCNGGEFRFASDFMDYVRWTLSHMIEHHDLEWTAKCPADWRVRSEDSIETRYEAKAKKAGLQSIYLEFVRRPRS